jgi:Tfp pilus assembly protein PilO
VIVARKPCTIYDVDVIGAVALVAISLAAWWTALAPWQRTWEGYRAATARYAAARASLHVDVRELEHFRERLSQLESVVRARANEVPRVDALPQLLRQMTEIAKDAQIELLSVTPQPAREEGPHWVCDIQVVGRGRSLDLIRFLGRLAEQNPYQSLRACTIVRPGQAAEPTCDLAWTIRLYMRSPGGPDDTGGRA